MIPTPEDCQLAGQLLNTPTGVCTSYAYGLFRKYGRSGCDEFGAFDREVIGVLKSLALLAPLPTPKEVDK